MCITARRGPAASRFGLRHSSDSEGMHGKDSEDFRWVVASVASVAYPKESNTLSRSGLCIRDGHRKSAAPAASIVRSTGVFCESRGFNSLKAPAPAPGREVARESHMEQRVLLFAMEKATLKVLKTHE